MGIRVSDSQTYNSVYDLIRGTAALSVFFVHLLPYILQTFQIDSDYSVTLAYPFALISVEFFFTLSGILLGPILYRIIENGNLKHNLWIFLQRRWYRTLPTYFLGFLSAILVFYVMAIPLPENLWAHFFFLQTINVADPDFYAVSWSLCIEEIFYIIFPIFLIIYLALTNKARLAYILTCVFIIMLSWVLRHIQLQSFDNWDLEIWRVSWLRLDSIAMGALFAIFHVKIPKWALNCSISLLGIMLILFYCYRAVSSDSFSLGMLIGLEIIMIFIPALCAVIIVFLAQTLTLKPSLFIRFCADISYPLYIFHKPIMILIFTFFGIVTLPVIGLIIAVVLLFSWLVFQYYETPFLKRKPLYSYN